MAGGYVGRYCIVDLSKQTTRVVEPDDGFYRQYLSGYGLGAAVITELQKPGTDPLAPEAHIGICSGLLSGTGASFSGRFMIVGKSPLTGGWGDANAGGYLSREIKRTGYDAVFFTGAAKKPVWVYITDEKIEFRDAADLWGKDNVDTQSAIRQTLGDKRVQVASIGGAGEKRSLISGIATDESRIAARSGLGAVMGSKQLKAVAFRGKLEIPLADPEAMKAITKRFLKAYKKTNVPDRLTVRNMGFLSKLMAATGINIPATQSVFREMLKKYGTPSLNVYSAMVGDTPIRNWGGSGYVDFTYENARRLHGDRVIETQKKRYACQNCPLGCGGIVDIRKGRFAGTDGHKTEYETWGAFGGLLLHDDFDTIVECNEMCNRAGIDSISTGGVIAFAIECFENGLIDEKTTGGLKLGWGKPDEIRRLTEMIIERDGFGAVLADGVKRAAEKIGHGAEKYAVHAGGQELPMHDSRLDHGFGIAYQCEPTPGRHTISSFMYSGLMGIEKMLPGAKKLKKQAKNKVGREVKLYAATSYYTQLMNGCGICHFGPLTGLVPITDYINAATGWKMSTDEYMKTGERLLSLRKAFNVREGVNADAVKLHDRAAGRIPLTKGPLKGVSVDMDTLQQAFFATVGWDPVTGGPTPEKRKELGIDHLF